MADISKFQTPDGTTYNLKDANAQRQLVSGTNIKTINNESILGSGNIDISSGGSDTKVTQTEIGQTGNNPYEVLLSGSADSTTRTEEAKKSSYLTFNPSTRSLSSDIVNTNLLNTLDVETETMSIFGQDYTGVIAEDSDNPLTQDRDYYVPDKSGTIALTSDIPTSPSDIGAQPTLVSGTNIKTINNESLLGSGNISISGGGGSKNIWYATCPTATGTAQKVVTTDSGDFTLTVGNMLRVLFTNANSSSSPTLKVDSNTTVPAVRVVTGTSGAQYRWQAGEVVDFVYNGTYFLMVNSAPATTTYYGLTKLSNSTSSTSTTLAATASAVKSAYDLANGKQDALVSGTNIKTINNQSILGSGNIDISGGGGGGCLINYVTNVTCFFVDYSDFWMLEIDQDRISEITNPIIFSWAGVTTFIPAFDGANFIVTNDIANILGFVDNQGEVLDYIICVQPQI